MKYSIIIPTFNSGKYIIQCLNSIFQIKRKDFEVIVVDGGSIDNTLQIVKQTPTKLLHSKNISISNSRNLAVKKAKGTNLVFIDSDCEVHPRLLDIADLHLKKYSCCGSYYKASKKAGFIAKTWLLIENKAKGLVDWLPGGTIIVNKYAFKAVRGFDEKLKTGEDFDFCHRLKTKGYKIYNDPRMASVHLGQTDKLTDFFSKEMWRGNSLLKGIKRHGILKEEVISTALTFYHLTFLIIFAITLFVAGLNNFVLLMLILPSFLLSIRKIIQTKKILYAHKFFFIILIYQIARAVSIIRYNQFKDLV